MSAGVPHIAATIFEGLWWGAYASPVSHVPKGGERWTTLYVSVLKFLAPHMWIVSAEVPHRLAMLFIGHLLGGCASPVSYFPEGIVERQASKCVCVW